MHAPPQRCDIITEREAGLRNKLPLADKSPNRVYACGVTAEGAVRYD
jgi:hypothetical protein